MTKMQRLIQMVMCQYTTEQTQMPLTFSVKPDSIYRIWFGFVEYSGDEITPPEITPIVRKGFTVIEWGGAVLD